MRRSDLRHSKCPPTSTATVTTSSIQQLGPPSTTKLPETEVKCVALPQLWAVIMFAASETMKLSSSSGHFIHKDSQPSTKQTNKQTDRQTCFLLTKTNKLIQSKSQATCVWPSISVRRIRPALLVFFLLLLVFQPAECLCLR